MPMPSSCRPTRWLVQLGGIAKLGERIRVIAGAAPSGFAVPIDEVGRRRAMDLPEGFVLLAGRAAPSDALALGFAAIARAGLDLPVVVIGAGEGEEPAIADLAAAAGIPERSLHVRGALEREDRAAVFGGAVTFVAPSQRSALPWRVLEALALGVPVIAASSPVHDEVIVDGGMLVDADRRTHSEPLWSRRSGPPPRWTASACWPPTVAAPSRGASRRTGCGSCTRSCSALVAYAAARENAHIGVSERGYSRKHWYSPVTSVTLFT